MALARLAITALAVLPLCAGTSPVQPVRVCEVMRNPAEYAGRPVMVFGRLSSRNEGRYLGEEKCPAQSKPVEFELHLDRQAGPRPDDSIEVDTAAVQRCLAEMRKTTPLRKFPFGSSDYDRWALVYGRLEVAPGKTLAGRLVFRSDSLIVFVNDQ
jgi:hypothetical protein